MVLYGKMAVLHSCMGDNKDWNDSHTMAAEGFEDLGQRSEW